MTTPKPAWCLIGPQGHKCARLRSTVPGRWACQAYPRGIPTPIVLGEVNHSQPYKGDKGLRYKPRV